MECARLKREQTKSEPVVGGAQKMRAPVATVAGRPLGLNHAHSPALRLDHPPVPSQTLVPHILQAKLTVNEPGDQYEQEADRVAEQVMRMPDTPLRVQRKCECGGSTASGTSCNQCADRPLLVQPRAVSQAEAATTAPGIVHEVLRSPGVSLDDNTRTFFEHRFQHDFGGVRIHSGTRASESAREFNARAYTVGQDVVFARGEYAPNTGEGKRLLAHELAHVLQQSSSSPPGLTTEISRADSSGEKTEALTPSIPARVQRSPVTVRGRIFEVGDIHLNPRAAVDVRQHGVLLPGPDQAHLLVTGGRQLGYEVSHTTPDDPFRWQRLKEIVDTGHADISGVSTNQDLPAQRVRGGTSIIERINLWRLGAGGLTLPRLSLVQTIYPNAPVYVASADNARDSVFYESGASGRGFLGSNSLAHELFGHLWLAMKGVPFEHGKQLTTAQGITDPMGRTFAGGVDDYIDRFAGAGRTALQSPTQRVSPAHLAAALNWIRTQGANHLTFQNNIGSITSEFGLQWETLSGNYEVLLFGPQPATASPDSAAGVLTAIVAWFNHALNADQKRGLRIVMDDFADAPATPSGNNRRRQLAHDVLAQLPSVTPAQTPATTP
jgi:hypothetical protein